MGRKEEGAKDIDGILLQRERIQIVLKLNNNPMHISDLSRALRIDRRLLTYHLQILENYGYLNSVYEVSNDRQTRGRALRIYNTTDKAKMRLAALNDLLKTSRLSI